jgi:hypothetical protein
MPLDVAFAPYRLAPGSPSEEAVRVVGERADQQLVAAAGDPLPARLRDRALAELPAGRAAREDEPCRAADGSPAGLAGLARACLVSTPHRARVAEAVRAAFTEGFGGVFLDRPDAPLALGLLGAGFCPHCLRDFGRHLSREYGEHFQPVDYLALAREAVSASSGALAFDQLPFGRDFWRFRTECLDDAVRGYARAARDAARAGGRAFEVVAQFEALGPAQARAARHLDAALFPGPEGTGLGIGYFRLLRAIMGRRPVAALVPGTPSALAAPQLARLAAAAASCGVELAGLEPGSLALAPVRQVARSLADEPGRIPAAAQPVSECCILYSTECDLWTGGRHRAAVVRAGEALAQLHLQCPVVTRIQDAPAGAALVLADAVALSAQEAKDVRRRLEGGSAVLAFGEPGQVDETGRAAGGFLPGGKAGGVKVGSGTFAELAALAPETGSPPPVEPGALEKAVSALLGRGRRAAGVSGRAQLLVVLHRTQAAVDAHLVSLGPARAQGVTLFLGADVAGGVRRGRFVSSDGSDVRIPLNPSGYSLSTVLPSFQGYAVLSLGG